MFFLLRAALSASTASTSASMIPMFSPGSPEGRRLVFQLGLAQMVSWGTLYFAFTVFLAPMHRRGTDLPRTEVRQLP